MKETIALLNRDNANFWRNVNVGSTITLKDEQTLMWLMSNGNGDFGGIEMDVLSRWRIKIDNGIEYIVFECKATLPTGDVTLYLAVKAVVKDVKRKTEIMEMRVYFKPDDVLEFGTRQQLLEQGDPNLQWIFSAPNQNQVFEACSNCGKKNVNRNFACGKCKNRLFNPGVLDYNQGFTKQIPLLKCLKCGTVAKNQRDSCSRCRTPLVLEFEFVPKRSALAGRCDDGVEHDKYVTVMEYQTDDTRCENPQYLFIELGGIKTEEVGEGESPFLPEGGYMMILQGYVINPINDTDVLAA